MARNKKTINISKEQLCELDVNVTLGPNKDVNTGLRNAQVDANKAGVANKVDNYVISSSELNDSKIYTKKEISEARKKFLEENSVTYNKKELFDLLRK